MKRKLIYIFMLMVIFTGILPVSAASADLQANSSENISSTSTCGQQLAEAETAFLATLPKDGQVPFDDPAYKAAAAKYIQVSKYCYEEIAASNSVEALQDTTPTFIDDGGIIRSSGPSADYTLVGTKWGSSTMGTGGGTVTYSFMGNGLDLSPEGVAIYGSSSSVTSLPGFQPCFITDIQNAFAAWQAVANIKFVQVTDSNTAFDAPNATGDIRIGAHAYDSGSTVLAHAYFPPPNGGSGAGDIHFNKDKPWSCNAGGIDIGVVAMHEIGHSIGLKHEETAAIAVMDPTYNSNLTGLQSDDINGARAIYAAAEVIDPAGNDTPGTATEITGLTYQNKVNTSAALPDSDTPDATDPNPITCSDGNGNLDSLAGGYSTVWYRYKTPLNVDESIQVDTNGTPYDTYVAVYEGDSNGNLPSYSGFVGCNDDGLNVQFSRFSFVGKKNTWYYFEVAQFKCYATDIPGCSTIPSTTGGDLTFNVNITNMDVTIGGSLQGRYYLTSGQSTVEKYAIDGGPVIIQSTTGSKIIASLNNTRKREGTTYWTGVAQSMGLPVGNISNIYVMPRYDYSDPLKLYNAILLANVDTVSRDITVTIGGTPRGTYTLGPAQSTYVKYSGLAGGPIVVSSATGAKIIASLYELRRDPTLAGWNGQSEMMGLPWEQLSDQYVIPIYFGANNPNVLDARLFIANPDTVSRTITVKIGGITRGSYTLAPGTGQVLKYAVDGGPVEISGPSGSKIIASLNQWRKREGTTYWTGVAQSMALPVNNISNRYVMPRYDYADPSKLYNAILLANVDTVSRDITVTIGGTPRGTYTLGPAQSTYVKYSGLAGGPIVVSSATGAKIIASLYELRRDPTLAGWNGQNEMMGLPWEQLSDTYLIPIYFGANNPNVLDARLFIAVP